MELEEGDLVLCTVERIEKTIVFVRIDDTGGEGSIVLSEIAPGRIRNIRDYVVPKKKIICKVLRILPTGNIELSLRRVSPKERKEVLEYYSEEKTYLGILKNVLGKNAGEKIKKLKEQKVVEFFRDAKENPKNLEKLFGKKDSEKILEILNSQKERTHFVKKEVLVKSVKENGLELIKSLFSDVKDAEIKYLAPGRYSVKTSAGEMKKADGKIKEIIAQLEKDAKSKSLEFSVKEK